MGFLLECSDQFVFKEELHLKFKQRILEARLATLHKCKKETEKIEKSREDKA